MKRSSILGLIFVVFVALWFFNTLYMGFTGKSIIDLILTDDLDVAEGESGKTCVDSDGGKDYFVLGTVEGYDKHGDFYVVNDSCKEKNLTEYFCKESSIMYVIYPCPNNCFGGVCLSDNDSRQTNETSSGSQSDYCTDTDGGLNYFFKGSCTDLLGTLEDVCVIGGSKGWFLREAYCQNGGCVYLDYDCLEGCSDSICLGEPEVNEGDIFFSPEEPGNLNFIDCKDSDKKNLYTKGIVTGFVDGKEKSFEDECILLMGDQTPLVVKNCKGEECFVREGFCIGGGSSLIEIYPCLNGCVSGACIDSRNLFGKIADFLRNCFNYSVLFI